MKVVIDIPEYNKLRGFVFNWEGDFEIETKVDEGTIILKANKDGLISMANHLLNLAQDEIPIGYHVHFDSYGGLEEGSSELIIEKS